jgi:hypothetical protein
MSDQHRDGAGANSPAGKSSRQTNRRPYSKPMLTEYGSIAKLTQGTRTNQSVGMGAGGFKMTCL